MFQKWIGAIVLLSAISSAQRAPSSVPAARLAHIRRGINLSEWFAQVYDPKGYTKEHFETTITAADVALTGTSDVVDTASLGLDRFDEQGHSKLAADPVALPFPEMAPGQAPGKLTVT